MWFYSLRFGTPSPLYTSTLIHFPNHLSMIINIHHFIKHVFLVFECSVAKLVKDWQLDQIIQKSSPIQLCCLVWRTSKRLVTTCWNLLQSMYSHAPYVILYFATLSYFSLIFSTWFYFVIYVYIVKLWNDMMFWNGHISTSSKSYNTTKGPFCSWELVLQPMILRLSMSITQSHVKRWVVQTSDHLYWSSGMTRCFKMVISPHSLNQIRWSKSPVVAGTWCYNLGLHD